MSRYSSSGVSISLFAAGRGEISSFAGADEFVDANAAWEKRWGSGGLNLCDVRLFLEMATWGEYAHWRLFRGRDARLRRKGGLEEF